MKNSQNHPFNKRFYATFILVVVLLTSHAIYAFNFLPHRKLELNLKAAEIVLPNGHIIKDYIASDEHTLFLSSDLVSDILGQQVQWDERHNTLNIGEIPTATVMSEKLKIYHYDYDRVHAFLYCPDAKMNKTMTMAGQTHNFGYYFTNVISASFNLDQIYHEINGNLGCEDFKASNGSVSFYLDDTLLKTYTLEANSLPTPISLPVSGGSKLTVTFSGFKPDTQINFVDVYIR